MPKSITFKVWKVEDGVVVCTEGHSFATLKETRDVKPLLWACSFGGYLQYTTIKFFVESPFRENFPPHEIEIFNPTNHKLRDFYPLVSDAELRARTRTMRPLHRAQCLLADWLNPARR